MKKLLILLALLFVVVLFFSCAPDMSAKFEGSWVYSQASDSLRYTFEGNTFKLEYDEGSGYIEVFNGTFKALGNKMTLYIEKVDSSIFKEMTSIDLEINTAFGISDTELVFMNMYEGGMPFVFVGGNTSTLEGKWNMPFSYKNNDGGFKVIIELLFDVNLEIKSDGTFIGSQEIPKETVSGKWAVDGDKLILSECSYNPQSNTSIASFFSNNDYTFVTIGDALGFVKGYGTEYEVKVYTKE